MSIQERVAGAHPRDEVVRTHGSFSEVFGDALRGSPVSVRGIENHDEVIPMHEWGQPAGLADRLLLRHCKGLTLDVGCGPGRMSAYLATRGHQVLGVDIVGEAALQARARGVAAVRRNVFDAMPAEGSWETVLLADGNIGIGGDPVALLRRTAELLQPGGRVVCDLAAPGTGIRIHAARLIAESKWSPTFLWARVGADAIDELAENAGFHVRLVGERHGRWFAVLTR
jgi:SAM-dependent methyltransferase